MHTRELERNAGITYKEVKRSNNPAQAPTRASASSAIVEAQPALPRPMADTIHLKKGSARGTQQGPNWRLIPREKSILVGAVDKEG